MKIIVYTCNIGHYDLYMNIPQPKDSVKFYYFMDGNKPMVGGGWKVQLIKDSPYSNRKTARYYKINSHRVLPEHDYSVWVDARFEINPKNVYKFVEKYQRYDMTCYEYPWRKKDCLYKEAVSCAMSKYNGSPAIYEQMKKYKAEGFPEQYGLCATGIIIRKNNDKVKKFNRIWWGEVRDFSPRDQLSHMYAVWKSGIKVNVINDLVYANEISKHFKHNMSRRKANKIENKQNGL